MADLVEQNFLEHLQSAKLERLKAEKRRRDEGLEVERNSRHFVSLDLILFEELDYGGGIKGLKKLDQKELERVERFSRSHCERRAAFYGFLSFAPIIAGLFSAYLYSNWLLIIPASVSLFFFPSLWRYFSFIKNGYFWGLFCCCQCLEQKDSLSQECDWHTVPSIYSPLEM